MNRDTGKDGWSTNRIKCKNFQFSGREIAFMIGRESTTASSNEEDHLEERQQPNN